MGMSKLESEFKKAGENGKRFRAAPFWSWNDDLAPEELRRQVRELKAGGLGGHFMHSRAGLVTPYLGQSWMAAVQAAVAESKKVGIDAWLYDEDCWPSGSAAGKVQDLGEDYWAKQLVLTETDPKKFVTPQETLAIFLARKSGERLSEVRRVAAKDLRTAAKSGQTVFAVSVKRVQDYVDLLDPEVTEAFLRLGCEPYDQAVGKEYGRAIPGIFTDEPGFIFPPWTAKFIEDFFRRWNYDLSDNLLSLFYPVGDWRKVRHDYWQTAADLLVNNFTRRYFEWCEARGLLLTGHILGEDNLAYQTLFAGAVMPHYRWMHWPGVDHLKRRIVDPLLNKQVTSVARQLGKARVFSESFAGGGWNMSFEDMKWIWNWQAVQGVNFLCQHLSAYSLRGLRKRDYPPSIFFQEPWWRDYKIFNDYIARLGTALGAGKPTAEILVIHPLASSWCVFEPLNPSAKAAVKLNDRLVNLTEALLNRQWDFDFGDESLLAEFGKVTGDSLQVGEAGYRVVIVPSSITLRATTLDLLERFAAAEGKIVFIGQIPRRVEGKASSRISRLLAQSEKLSEKDLGKLFPGLEQKINRGFQLQTRPQGKIYACERLLEDGRRLWFFANLERKGTKVTLNIKGQGSLQQWDLATGEISDYPVSKTAAGLQADLVFAGAEGKLLVFDPKGKPLSAAKKKSACRRQTLGEKWQIEPNGPNALTVDYCRYRADGGKWSPLLPTIEVNERVQKIAPGANLEVRYSFTSLLAGEKPPNISLVLEQPQRFAVKLNGKRLAGKTDDWWLDKAFCRLDIAGKMQAGENVLELSTRIPKLKPPSPYENRLGARTYFNNAHRLEIESCYLLGDFAVEAMASETKSRPAKFALCPTSDKLQIGDLGPQGLPFYRGTITYTQEIEGKIKNKERAWLELSGVEGIVVKVKVNRRRAGTLVWQPWRLEITELLCLGKNTITLEVTGSNRNLLGHHHNIHGEVFTHPDYFRMRNVWDNNRLAWTHRYNLIPFGLTGPVRIIYESA
jgi:hypothetical protein